MSHLTQNLLKIMKIHILHEFIGGAWGGGNQFLKALREYLKVNGNSGAAIEEAVDRWKSISSGSSKVEKTTMVVTEMDSTVETK